jgi:flavodoxin
MKIAIVFYSFSGNTGKACQFLKDKLIEKKVDVDWRELKLEKEEKSFIKQCLDARSKKTPPLLSADYDVSSYDLVIFASPVWAFTFAPALRSFLNNAAGLNDKKTAYFFTHGSSAGTKNALNELESLLKEKGARVQFSRSISGAKTKDNTYLQEQFKPLLENIAAQMITD